MREILFLYEIPLIFWIWIGGLVIRTMENSIVYRRKFSAIYLYFIKPESTQFACGFCAMGDEHTYTRDNKLAWIKWDWDILTNAEPYSEQINVLHHILFNLYFI